MKRFSIFIVFTTLLLIGCVPAAASHSESLLKQIEHESESAEPIDIDVPNILLEIRILPVEYDGVEPFHTPARTDEIAKYPCSSCHETPLNSSNVRSDAHWEIELNHADASVMSCTTCHAPDNLDVLHTLTGEPVEFDASYTVCAQCHSTQVDDWAGGAHGKQVGGWVNNPRVVETCVSCHNPHEPQWDTRWPAVTGGGLSEQE